MRTLGAIVFGSAAGVALVGGAEAADLPTKKAAPAAEYVRVCTAFGAGFFTIPGSDACLKIGGAVRYGLNVRPAAPTNVNNQAVLNTSGQLYQRDSYYDRGRVYLNLEARGATDYGPLVGVLSERFTYDSLPAGPYGGGKTYVSGNAAAYTSYAQFRGLPNNQTWFDAAYVQWAGVTAGVKHSYFDFYTHGYEIGACTLAVSDQPLPLIAYTAQFGSGFSATLSADDPAVRQIGNGSGDATATDNNPKNAATAAYLTYGGARAPDVVGDIRAEGSWGAVQIAGAAHEVNSASIYSSGGALAVGYTPSAVWGYALEGGAKFNLDALSKGDSLTVQASYDKGAMAYVNAGSSGYAGTTNVYSSNQAITVPGNDAFVLPDGSIAPSQAAGVFAGVQHYWVPTVRSAVFGSYLQISNPSAAQLLSASADNARFWDLGANVFWSPIKSLDLGAEVVYTSLDLSGLNDLHSYNPAGVKVVGYIPANSDDWRARLRLQYSF